MTAHIIPFELLLFSYAILGPAHYLTEISWLHDRSYFVENRWSIVPFIPLCALMIIFPDVAHITIITTCMYAVSLVIARRWRSRLLIMTGGIIICGALTWALDLKAIWMLVPTLIHVFVMTALFMWYGATKENSKIGKLSVLVLFIAALTFFLQFKTVKIFDEYLHENFRYLTGTFTAAMHHFGLETGGSILKLAKFASFAYTYHYLNWFAKTRVIQWHKISTKRAAFIVAAYALSISAYAYHYGLGVSVTLALSLGHVVLELPLNAITIKSLVRRA